MQMRVLPDPSQEGHRLRRVKLLHIVKVECLLTSADDIGVMRHEVLLHGHIPFHDTWTVSFKPTRCKFNFKIRTHVNKCVATTLSRICYDILSAAPQLVEHFDQSL